MMESYHRRRAELDESSESSSAPSIEEESIHSGGESTRDEVKEVQKLASAETRRVRFWRLLVLLVLAAVGAAVSTYTYRFLVDDEEDQFVEGYFRFANTIQDISRFRAQSLFNSHRSLSETLTAFEELQEDVEWPFVTYDLFEVGAHHLREQSRVEGVVLAPIIDARFRGSWEDYSVLNQNWIEDSRRIAEEMDPNFSQDNFEVGGQVYDQIWLPCADILTEQCPAPDYPIFLPWWQSSPPPYTYDVVNLDLAELFDDQAAVEAVFLTNDIIFLKEIPQEFVQVLSGSKMDAGAHVEFHDQFVESTEGQNVDDRPHVVMATPIFNQLERNERIQFTALLVSMVTFDSYVADLLPGDVSGIDLVIRSSCDQVYTYRLTGNKAEYVGNVDAHDPTYNEFERTVDFSAYLNEELSKSIGGHCVYTFHLYPTSQFAGGFNTTTPVIFTAVVASTFLLMAVVFFVYDWMGNRRNAKVIDAAARTNAIVASLFPANVRDQLVEEAKIRQAPQAQLKSFLNEEEGGGKLTDDNGHDLILPGKPLAELFPEATIMFADIAGFTAWSSVREPSQVFTLLETLYRAFDTIAKRRRIFKVETIGDCYVAVAGLPDPRKDHAVAMARFATDCLEQMRVLTRKLEVILGPDTGDLALRVGLHSGPVTAGVLRGEKSRFQLFGDTMNTASRMESNSMRDKIQVSQETADLLIEAGKAEWLVPREDKIHAKGKGELQTFWLYVSAKASELASQKSGGSDSAALQKMPSNVEATSEVTDKVRALSSGKAARLIDWNVDVLARLLRQIVARRNASSGNRICNSINYSENFSDTTTPLEEVKEIITLPEFDAAAARNQVDPDSIELSEEVMNQLHDFVTNMAALYKDNPFHNFEHASHVTMSVVKLMSRIVAPADLQVQSNDVRTYHSSLHDHTYGITSDPLTQFACVFSALIHDVDHTGVPNTQLIKENAQIATFYKGKSVAEQNSVDLAWDVLMDESYQALRDAIFPTQAEKGHFRQIVVNSVMATDIMDKDLKSLRNARWEKAFSEGAHTESAVDARNRKATIVIEHLIQASDVAHTMQHWHIYRKWNERLFEELYKAYKDGRAAKDPSEFWYTGEIGFFDFYIIPLAKKLKDCGVFGVSSDEYLNYAMKNRKEWEVRGAEVVSEMIAKISKRYGEEADES